MEKDSLFIEVLVRFRFFHFFVKIERFTYLNSMDSSVARRTLDALTEDKKKVNHETSFCVEFLGIEYAIYMALLPIKAPYSLLFLGEGSL